jgi:Phosphoribosylanthranilate isomerase
MMCKIKICGIMREQDCDVLNEVLPDLAGFIFWEKSRRYIMPETALRFRERLDKRIKTVGVFVDEAPENIAKIAASGAIDVIQLHGKENDDTINRVKELTGKPVVKAFVIRDPVDIDPALRSSADMLLLDNGRGTGESFDWENLEDVDRLYYLAGGLDPENVRAAIDRYCPYGVDVSSGVETDGQKDPDKIRKFVKAVRG